jgi:hypothetical protein
LIMQLAKTVQRVEIAGTVLQERGIKTFRGRKLTYFMRASRAAEHARHIRLRKLRNPVAHWFEREQQRRRAICWLRHLIVNDR